MPDYDAASTGDARIARNQGLSKTAIKCEGHPSTRNASVPAQSPGPAGKQSPKVAIIKKVTADDVLRSFNTWAFKREQPADLQRMREIISSAIGLEQPVSFVLYW